MHGYKNENSVLLCCQYNNLQDKPYYNDFSSTAGEGPFHNHFRIQGVLIINILFVN